MKSRAEYEAEIERLADGDSNDSEIDGLTEMVRELLDDRERLANQSVDLADFHTLGDIEAQIAWLEEIAARKRGRPSLESVDTPDSPSL